MKAVHPLGGAVTIGIVGAVGFVLYTASQLFPPDGRGPRAFVLMNAPYIAPVATLPRAPEFSGYDDRGEPIQLDLGYSYREISAIWMPFAAFEDQGLVMFAGTGNRTSVAPVTPVDRAAIANVVGTDLTERYRFPYHAHIWGWLPVVALALSTWVMVKRAERKRDKAGIM